MKPLHYLITLTILFTTVLTSCDNSSKNEEIVQPISSRIFSYISYNKIVELNPSTGSEIGDIATLGSEYFFRIVFLESTNELVGIQTKPNSRSERDFVKINIETGQVTRTPIRDYEDFITGK